MKGKELRDLLNKMSDEDLEKPIYWYNTEYLDHIEITEVRDDGNLLMVN